MTLKDYEQLLISIVYKLLILNCLYFLNFGGESYIFTM